MPRELSERDRKVLWARARDLCSFPQCRTRLTHDAQDADTGEEFLVILGEEAHIYSAQPNGPRFDPNFPAEDLETYKNRILLCRNHHRQIDADRGRAYSPRTLISMKVRHERAQKTLERTTRVLRAYLADQYEHDDRVLFRQVRLDGPKVDNMFVDVPFAAREDLPVASLLEVIARDYPGDAPAEPGFVVTGAAQALLHPRWAGNALIVGGPGQGKSTLLQYICQFHRARTLGRDEYTGAAQKLRPLTETIRTPIRIDLRAYAEWATLKQKPGKRGRANGRRLESAAWPPLESYLAEHISRGSGGQSFGVDDLAVLLANEPVLMALDGLDEVADLDDRAEAALQVTATAARLRDDAADLVIVVATRPGVSNANLWNTPQFPILHLQRLTSGLRLQYLQRWCAVTEIADRQARRLQRTFLEHESQPHIRDLASYPMQLAILLHLLHRRGLLPQQRTELYGEYLQTFLDREETEEKEPLLASQRKTIIDIHAFLGWRMQAEAESRGTAGTISRERMKQLVREHLSGQASGVELADRLFDAMEARVLCLVERVPGQFQFEVQSLREYFAAWFIVQNSPPRGLGNSRTDCLEALLVRPYWLNTCRFLVGLLSKIEVRGIRPSLTSLNSGQPLSLHPQLRIAALRLLEDRAYQGQPTEIISEVVSFILDGPGVVLANDGLLSESGLPLSFAEDAGRREASAYLERRLEQEISPELLPILAQLLRRMTATPSDLLAWWVATAGSGDAWLETGAALGLLAEAASAVTLDAIATASVAYSSEDRWAAELLATAGFGQAREVVIDLVMSDLNDGAIEVLDASADTDLGRLTSAARSLRNPATGAKLGAPRTRVRRPGSKRVAAALNAARELAQSLLDDSDVESLSNALRKAEGVWGSEGWVMRQAIAALPSGIDFGKLQRALGGSLLAPLCATEEALRAARNSEQSVLWRNLLPEPARGLDRRAWVFSLLTLGSTSLVLDLAEEVNEVVAELSKKHYRALLRVLEHVGRTRSPGPLQLQDHFRRGIVPFSPKTLWLLVPVASAAAGINIRNMMMTRLPEIVDAGLSDLTPLIAGLGDERTLPIESLRSSRAALASGAWQEKVKLGRLTNGVSENVLTKPEEWPAPVVQLAVQKLSRKLAEFPPLQIVARDDRWFELL